MNESKLNRPEQPAAGSKPGDRWPIVRAMLLPGLLIALALAGIAISLRDSEPLWMIVPSLAFFSGVLAVVAYSDRIREYLVRRPVLWFVDGTVLALSARGSGAPAVRWLVAVLTAYGWWHLLDFICSGRIWLWKAILQEGVLPPEALLRATIVMGCVIIAPQLRRERQYAWIFSFAGAALWLMTGIFQLCIPELRQRIDLYPGYLTEPAVILTWLLRLGLTITTVAVLWRHRARYFDVEDPAKMTISQRGRRLCLAIMAAIAVFCLSHHVYVWNHRLDWDDAHLTVDRNDWWTRYWIRWRFHSYASHPWGWDLSFMFIPAWSGDLEEMQWWYRFYAVEMHWHPEYQRITRMALQEAITKHQDAVVDYLLSMNVDEGPPKSQGAWLQVAAGWGNLHSLTRLAERGHPLPLPYSNGVTVLYLAATSGRVENVQFFLDRGQDPKVLTTNGNSIFSSAVRGNSYEMIEFLLGLGVEPTAADRRDLLWVFVESQSRHQERADLRILDWILGLGTDINAVRDGRTVLADADDDLAWALRACGALEVNELPEDFFARPIAPNPEQQIREWFGNWLFRETRR